MSFTKKKCMKLFQDFKNEVIAKLESETDTAVLKEYILSYEEFPKKAYEPDPDTICIGHRSNGEPCNRVKISNQSFCCIHLRKKQKPENQVDEVQEVKEEEEVKEEVKENDELKEGGGEEEEEIQVIKKEKKKKKRAKAIANEPDVSTSEVWIQNINGILYYVDKDNNLFSAEEFKQQSNEQVKSLTKIGNVSVDELGISHILLL